MRILQVHNRYKLKGGEDSVVAEERKLLREKGHHVTIYEKNNADIRGNDPIQKLKIMTQLERSPRVARDLAAIITREKPDVCHVHNVIPLISPVVFTICREHNLPVIQSLHNFRLICTNSLLFRDGEPCELCVGNTLYRGVRFKCYRESYIQTFLLANMLERSKHRGTWYPNVDHFLCLSEFAKEKFVRGGLPQDKIIVKPNFVSQTTLPIRDDGYFLYVGRMEKNKGVDDLVSVAREFPDITFHFVGDRGDVEIPGFQNIQYLGKMDRSDTLKHMANCRAVLFPSRLYEGMPMTILEAFSLKKPVIARDHGIMKEMVNSDCGSTFQTVSELKQYVKSMNDQPGLCIEMGQHAYRIYSEKYSEETGYQNLLAIYNLAKNRSIGN